MDYSEALRYLERLQEFRVKLGLERIEALLAELGHPERSYPVVLIAGTNGKGSVGAFLSSILQRRYKVGFNSSPHLIEPRERIRINMQPLSQEQFASVIEEVKEASERVNQRFSHPVTFFETLTAAAFLAFAEERVDVGLFEVGMGGRLDATNAADAALSIITEISYDHVQTLGRRLAQIAFEKAQIIKPGKPSLTGSRKEVVLDVLQQVAAQRASRLHLTFSPLRRLEKKGESEFLYDCPEAQLCLRPSLPGDHQAANAAVAARAAMLLAQAGLKVSFEEIEQGVSEAFWPARIEKVKESPEIILDAAHNLEGAQALATYLRGLPEKPGILLFGLLRDKDLEGIGALLFPLFDRIIVTEPPSHRRMEAERVAAFASRYSSVEVEKDAAKAVELALKRASGSDRIVICGSIYLVGKAREEFLRRGWVKRL